MLVHVDHVVAICCHFGAFYDCHRVVILVACWSSLVSVLSLCCHVVVIVVHWMAAMLLALC